MKTRTQHGHAVYRSPLGPIGIRATERGVESITFLDSDRTDVSAEHSEAASACIAWLDDYFSARPASVDSFSLELHGTPFQTRVWKALLAIPVGSTTTYAKLAKRVGKPGAAQAVGQAVKKNPLAILVPCHRVVPTDAKAGIGGYAGGKKKKEWLLKHEQSSIP